VRRELDGPPVPAISARDLEGELGLDILAARVWNLPLRGVFWAVGAPGSHGRPLDTAWRILFVNNTLTPGTSNTLVDDVSFRARTLPPPTQR
jgi:hypothetical protein